MFMIQNKRYMSYEAEVSMYSPCFTKYTYFNKVGCKLHGKIGFLVRLKTLYL